MRLRCCSVVFRFYSRCIPVVRRFYIGSTSALLPHVVKMSRAVVRGVVFWQAQSAALIQNGEDAPQNNIQAPLGAPCL